MKSTAPRRPSVSVYAEAAPAMAGLSGSFVAQPAGFSVWSFEQGRWQMVEDRSGPGFVPGGAPAGAGKFAGDTLKVTSVRAPRKT